MTISNKSDPKFLEYYQLLADIISIFWQFHKERILSGETELAYMFDHGPNKPMMAMAKYSPQAKLEFWRSHNNYNTHRVIDDFNDALQNTLNASWQKFLKELGLEGNDHFPTSAISTTLSPSLP